MTLSEFKAWFEGFSEGIDKAPTEKQFAKIKAKVAEITSTPTTYPVFIDRYVAPWRRTWTDYWSSDAAGGNDFTYLSTSAAVHPDQDIKHFDSHAAFRELGRMEVTN